MVLGLSSRRWAMTSVGDRLVVLADPFLPLQKPCPEIIDQSFQLHLGACRSRGKWGKKGREKVREALRLAESVFELFLNILTFFIICLRSF